MSEDFSNKILVGFDGVCNLCNSFVDFLIQRDAQDKFRFFSLQSEWAGRHLPAEVLSGEPGELDSVVVLYQGRFYRKSRAALLVLTQLGGVYRLLFCFRYLPVGLTDAVYNMIARNRYKWFGQKDTCRIPTEAEKAKFLDSVKKPGPTHSDS